MHDYARVNAWCVIYMWVPDLIVILKGKMCYIYIIYIYIL